MPLDLSNNPALYVLLNQILNLLVVLWNSLENELGEGRVQITTRKISFSSQNSKHIQ